MQVNHRVVVGLLCLALPALATASDWPHLRGPNYDGSARGGGFFGGEGVKLELAWKAGLGSGYSGIAVAGGRAVTMFSDGEADYVVAFDVADGREVWRHRLDATNKGHDGSADGPLSSPVIDDDVVYALGPNGQLMALALADGDVVWSRTLQDAFGSAAPHFGFTTTPLVEGKVLVVQMGGSDGRAISGLDKRTGKKIWSFGKDGVSYQSPAVMTLAGRRQLVTVDDRKITGVVPATGEVLWRHELGEKDSSFSANPTPVGNDRLLVFVNEQAVVLEVERAISRYEVSEAYRSTELGRSYAMPVFHDGHLYGFKGQFLTCVDAATGERVWKSRPPGGRGLILVDGHLVIFGSEGRVVVAEATPEGYVEKARTDALDGSGYTWPAFADGKVFIRNLEQIASISVTKLKKAAVAEITPMSRPETAFGSFVAKIEAVDDKKRIVDGYFGAREDFPIVENEYVHFVYRGEVDDIAIAGTMIASGNPEAMDHVEGTDLYYKTYKLEPGGRWEYSFTINYDEHVTDPLNPRTVPPFQGKDAMSEVRMPGYDSPSFDAEPEGAARGKLDSFEYESKRLGNKREVKVYLPPGYDDSDRSYPLLIVNNGLEWVDKGRMTHVLDNLAGKSIEPVVVVFLASTPQWWLEAGGSNTDGYVEMLADELVPYLEERYRLIDAPESRALFGHVFYGLSATYAAFKYPDVFGKVAAQSVYLGLGAGDALAEAIRTSDAELTVYLDWNRYESRSADDDWDLREDGKTLAKLLEDSGHTFVGGEVLDSFGWGAWRARADDVLVTLFPAK
jgi:enterochelin esterase-like enzyme/outer membrane protein assembly factor BamB